MGFTTSITIIAPATGTTCQALAPPVTGVLWDVTNGLPVVGRIVTLKYNSTIIGTEITDIAGTYSFLSPNDVYIPVAGALTLTIDWPGDGVYDPSSNTSPITMSYCGDDAELASKFFASPFRTPAQINTENGERLWGAILCIDPNGLRPVGPKGPIYYLLDTMTIRPGLSDKSGAFEATINDQKTSIDSAGNQKRVYDMTLFTDDTIYIRDNDEFWIGVQQGPEAPNNEDGLDYVWAVNTGGRQWLMGGWITKRYYIYEEDSRITATIEGRCYMDLWRKSFFGTPEIPRNYTSSTDLMSIIPHVLADVNAGQEPDFQFSMSAFYWPVAPMGVEWLKEFREEDAFSVMEDACDEAGWEWQIVINPYGTTPAQRRAVEVYDRGAGPISAQQLIEFDRNIRDLPRIIMGDTTHLTSGVIVTGLQSTIPPEVSGWIQMGLWPDISWSNREYTMISTPYPPNSGIPSPSGGRFSDASLVIDDEGRGALNLQKSNIGAGYFYLIFNYYTDESDQPHAARMDIDLRQWRRLKLRFRHPTRETPDLGTLYRIGLHSTGTPALQFLNSSFEYDFGEGDKQDDPTFIDPTDGNPNDPQVSDHDTINDENWTEIDLLLPEIDPDGMTVNKHHGWIEVTGGGAPDPTAIDFVSIIVQPAESEPGQTYPVATIPPAFTGRPFIHRVALNTNIPAGARYLTIANPEQLFGRGTGVFPTGIGGETLFWNPRPVCLIAGRSGGSWKFEPVYVAGINGPDYPNPAYPASGGQATVRLENGIDRVYHNDTYLYIIGGWSISFSQIHFERNILLEKAASSVPAHLENPKRYRLTDYQEIEYSSEAEARADQDLLKLGVSRQSIRVRLDGDPRQRIGMRVTSRLDPERSADGEPDMIFQNVSMFIDDVEHRVVGTDFYNTFLLGLTSDTRSKGLDDDTGEIIDISNQRSKILRNARGITPLTRGVKQPT